MSHSANHDELVGWFAGRLPDAWFTGTPDVSIDREEILVVGEIADVELTGYTTDAARAAARASRVERFREETRGDRMAIAEDAQHRFRKVVSWGVRIAERDAPLHDRQRPGDDSPSPAGAAGAGHPRRGRGRAEPERGPRLVREARRRARGRVDRRAPRRTPRRRGGAQGRPDRGLSGSRSVGRPTDRWVG